MRIGYNILEFLDLVRQVQIIVIKRYVQASNYWFVIYVMSNTKRVQVMFPKCNILQMDKCSFISYEHTNIDAYQLDDLFQIWMILCKYNYLIIPLRKFNWLWSGLINVIYLINKTSVFIILCCFISKQTCYVPTYLPFLK